MLDRNNPYSAIPQLESMIQKKIDAAIKDMKIDVDSLIKLQKNINDTESVSTGFRINGHSSEIGDWQRIDFPNTTYAKTGTPQVVGTFNLDTGVWLALARVIFANKSNATYRAMAITSNSASWTNGYVQTPATNGAGTALQFSYICCPVADNSPYYIRVNAGADSVALSNISVTYVRIK